MRVLKGVSRSFVLTIQALPKGLRRPIGLAYLLARTSDTIADTAAAPLVMRVDCLREIAGKIAGEGSEVFRRVRGIEPANESERYLLANLDRVTAALASLPGGDRTEIVLLMGKIMRGQEMDLLKVSGCRNGEGHRYRGGADEYTYLVAGCVGEFWTRICSFHLACGWTVGP